MAQPKIEFAVRKPAEGITILDFRGDLTGLAEESLMGAYEAARHDGAGTLILNLSGVASMNSAGAGVLIALVARAGRHRKRLLAYGLTTFMQDAFALTGLNQVIGLYACEVDVLRAAAS